MEVLQNALSPLSSSSFSLPSQSNPTSSSSFPRPSSFAPISSATLFHKTSTDRLQGCTYTGSNGDLALKEPQLAEVSCAGTSKARTPRRTFILMRNSAAAGYAAALAEIGQSKHILDLLHVDLKKLATFLHHKQLHSFLLNPSIHDTHKKNILTRIADESAFMPYTVNLLNIIVHKKRTALLKDVVKEFEVIYNQIAEVEVTVVLSAAEIDAAPLARITKKIQRMSDAKNVRMKNVLDSSLVAGYIIKYGNDASRLIDSSAKD